ncbi:MAG: hypothetical protein ACKOU7_01945, partial [Ferruginibacter sp.]
MAKLNRQIRYTGLGGCLFVMQLISAVNLFAQDAGLRVESSSGNVYLNIGSNTTMNITAPGNTGGVRLESGGAIDNSGVLNLAAGTWVNNGIGLVNGSTGTVKLDNSSVQPLQGTVPTVFYDLVVNNAAGVNLSKDVQVTHDLLLTAGNLSIGANTLIVNGTISGSGTITGSPASNLVLGAAAGTLNFTQTSASTRSLNNLILNTGSSATLGNALDVYGTISLNAASLNLAGKNLTLKSNATNTARIADLTGSTLTGATNVTMERYIKLRAGGSGRAYRLLAPTVNTTGSIRANWMEGGMNTAIGTNDNPVPNYGTQISGSGGNVNGFDKTQTNAASLYAVANAVSPTYSAITSTGASLNAKTGYFMYIRGDRSMDMTIPLAPNMPTSATTLRTTGTLVTGTQTTFTNAFTGGGALNLVTNPYPSPINWSLVKAASSNITDYYTIWDPNFGTRGGFVTVSSAGIASSGLATQFIQSGQAFFVESNGGVPVVNIQESHKAAGNNNEVFLTPPPPAEAFRTELYFTEPNGYRRVVDGAIALYDNSYSAAVDDKDAKEVNNWDENIAYNREGKHLAIECRPVVLTRDTLPLFMNNMKQQAYEFEFTPAVFSNPNLKVELVDNFLNKRTLLSASQPTTVSFDITADAASKSSDRFMVVFGSFGGPLAIDAISIKAAQKNTGVAVDWTSKTETGMVSYEIERSTVGNSFTKLNTVAAVGNSSGPVSYNYFDAMPLAGTNFYRVKATDKSGNTRYSDIVPVTIGKGEPGISIYPNPVPGSTFKIDMNNLLKGAYLLNLYNEAGQLIYTEKLMHDGNPATKMISLKTDIAKGVY